MVEDTVAVHDYTYKDVAERGLKPLLLTVMYQGRKRRTREHKKCVPSFYQRKLGFGRENKVWDEKNGLRDYAEE